MMSTSCFDPTSIYHAFSVKKTTTFLAVACWMTSVEMGETQ